MTSLDRDFKFKDMNISPNSNSISVNFMNSLLSPPSGLPNT